MKRQIILFASLFIFSLNLTLSYEKSNNRLGYYNEENADNKEKNKITSMFNDIKVDIQNDVEENLDNGKNVLEDEHLVIGQEGQINNEGSHTENESQRSAGSRATGASVANRESELPRATELREGETTVQPGTQLGESGTIETLQSQESRGPQGTSGLQGERVPGALSSVSQTSNPDVSSRSEQPQTVPESSRPEGTSTQSQPRRSTESDASADNKNGSQTNVRTFSNSSNSITSPQTEQPSNNENNTVSTTSEVKYLDLLYDDLLTNSEGKHQVDFGENHKKYNIFRKHYDDFVINQKEYDIIKKLLNSIFRDNNENEKMKKLVSVFQKALTDKKFHDQFKNFIHGIYGFAKRHSYLRNEKIQNDSEYKEFFENAVDLLNTL
ncbi:MSP7-like protein [Plasmodium reichenowi]|uniref:MSP7-like protein n=1 Tax=Plasmodium reichenowi TaxID=5854 RepID=A0A151L768_PLARE|nr:MSP7-like protein [Plasmodium reichenowi]KYN94782.1 MSP7-like protein [Plasmodium reichenowi]